MRERVIVVVLIFGSISLCKFDIWMIYSFSDLVIYFIIYHNQDLSKLKFHVVGCKCNLPTSQNKNNNSKSINVHFILMMQQLFVWQHHNTSWKLAALYGTYLHFYNNTFLMLTIEAYNSWWLSYCYYYSCYYYCCCYYY